MFFHGIYSKISLNERERGYEGLKKLIAIALSALMALSLMACQATPEQGIVKEKNLDKMIEAATKTPAPAASGSASQSPAVAGEGIAEKIGAEKTYVKELVDAKDKVKIHVNADVTIPDAAGVTVQRVERANYTQQQVDVLVKNLMHGDIFSGDDYKLTKSEIQQQILDIQAAMAKMSDDPKQNPASGLRIKGGGKETLQYRIDELQEQLKTAPDTVTKTPSDGKLVPMNMDTDYATGEKLYTLSQSDKGFESLRVYNYDDSANMLDYTSEKNGFSKSMGYFSTKEEIEKSMAWANITSEEIAQIPDIQTTVDQAKQKAEDLIKALGVENMVCYSADKAYGGSNEMTADNSAYINPRKCVWFLRYMRSVNSVPITYTVWDCMKVEKDAQSAPWAYEDMTFAIDDSGIVGFSWRSPYKITGTVTENSNLASFKDIMHVFDTMSLVVNAWDGYAEGSPDLTGVDITVDHIKFGLTRITEQDKRDSGLLVPAWDFMGTATQIITRDGQSKSYGDGPIPILTVNAIDGSIINRSLGY